MKVKMLRTKQVLGGGVVMEGKVYDLPTEEAERFMRQGWAVSAPKNARKSEIEGIQPAEAPEPEPEGEGKGAGEGDGEGAGEGDGEGAGEGDGDQ